MGPEPVALGPMRRFPGPAATRSSSLTGVVVVALLLAAGTSVAQAQPPTTVVGDAPDGMAGIRDVPVAVLRPELSGAVVASAGLGVSIDEPWPETSRYRLQGALGGSISPLPWLAVGLQLRGRWDDVARSGQSDTGLAGEPVLTLRLTTEPVEGLGLALDTAVWMYGGDAPSLTPESTSLRARGVVSYRLRLDGDLHLALSAAIGGLLDNSRAAAPRALTDVLSPQDRVSLGVSDFSAVLIGAGAILRAGMVEVLAEAGYRLLVGDGAPDAGGSPLHVVVGARVRPIGELLELGLYADVLASSVDASFVAAGAPAAPVDPRFTLTLAVGVRFGVEGSASDAGPGAGGESAGGGTAAPSGATGTLTGVVHDGAGTPVEGATIEVYATESGEDGVGAGAVEPRTTRTDAEGRWRLEGVPVGRARVVVRREGADPVETTVEVSAGEAPAELSTRLGEALPQGEIRGTIQGSDGRPLEGASIRILPLGLERTTDADGAFEAEVPPGRYEVEVRAPGHRPQTRSVEVVEQGVVLLNAQLLRAR